MYTSIPVIDNIGLNIPLDEINLIRFRWITEGVRPYNRIESIVDIDDLLMNALGALIGWVIFRLLKEHLSKLQNKVSVQSNNIGKIPLLLREEAYFYMAGAFAGMFFVFFPFLRPLL